MAKLVQASLIILLFLVLTLVRNRLFHYNLRFVRLFAWQDASSFKGKKKNQAGLRIYANITDVIKLNARRKIICEAKELC
jgi:hypothetical protein